jgi:hypothetical protein
MSADAMKMGELCARLSALTFVRFEGCAAECKHNSQNPVVLRWEGHQPIYNPRFLAFASYYEFRLVAM